jgi:hypothetical protein
MLFFIDVDNKERFKIQNSLLGDVRVKDLAKAVKSDEKIHLDIRRLGILEIDDVIIDYPKRAAIFKCSLILDYRVEQQFDWIEMEDSLWTSQIV